MKILWLTNIILPKISSYLSENASVGGGWLTGLSDDLLKQNNIELHVCFPSKTDKVVSNGKIDNLYFYKIPSVIGKDTKYDIQLEIFLNLIVDQVKPDIIHIFGTEFPHTLAMVNTAEKLDILSKVIISLQGLVSIYQMHFFASLPNFVIHGNSLRNLIKKDNVIQQRNSFNDRGKFEIEALLKTEHVIGRTTWDKACLYQINSSAHYHFCNETLRTEFYNHKWSLEDCTRNSIFISQAGYPIKGFHYMLESMPEICRKYPNTHLYVTGKNPMDLNSKYLLSKQTYYQKYIVSLIKRLGLEKNITFLGNLDEKSMCERFLKSHVFVLPSSIENSPNSLGEAMILGLPCVSSNVGGVSDMLIDKHEGFLYQHDAVYMLTYYVCEIFGNDNLALDFSKNARKHALKTHNREINRKRINEIYSDVLNKKVK